MEISTNKLKHIYKVAKRAEEIAKDLGLTEQEQEDMFLLGWVHDFGYYFVTNTQEHGIVAGEILERNGYHYAKEVALHGNPNPTIKTLQLDILNIADMQIDAQGKRVTFAERLEDIKLRYGFDSHQYKSALKVVKDLLARYSDIL